MAAGTHGEKPVNMGEFFNMGGYALYVWGSYVFAVIVLGINIVQAKRRLRRSTEQTTGS
ncbi:MAG: heme exporter protein CcmD [Granulosicoccaceae bacterium]